MSKMSNHKRIVFFDGDGTIWYPKKTKHKEKPHWIYSTGGNYRNHSEYLMLIPTVLNTLKKLKKLGVIIILLSTHPESPEEGNKVVEHRIKHFNLDKLFDEIHATRDFHASKGEFIVDILNKRKIPKSKALMVGDSYRWDYRSARDVGIDSFLMESEYLKRDPQGKRVKKTIKKLSDILIYFQ